MEIKDIRQNCVQNTATRNILQTDDYQLNNNLAENSQDYRALGMMAFNKLGDSRNVLFTIFFSHEQAHNNRAQSPGNRIPAGTQTNTEGVLGNADSRRTANSQTDDSNTNQRRRKSASRKSKVFVIAFTTFFAYQLIANKATMYNIKMTKETGTKNPPLNYTCLLKKYNVIAGSIPILPHIRPNRADFNNI